VVNGEKFNAVLRWGDEYLSRWTLLVGHNHVQGHRLIEPKKTAIPSTKFEPSSNEGK
jgi:hypothetical protein